MRIGSLKSGHGWSKPTRYLNALTTEIEAQMDVRGRTFDGAYTISVACSIANRLL